MSKPGRSLALAVAVSIASLLLAGCRQASPSVAAPSDPAPSNRTINVQTKDGARQAIVVHPASVSGKPALVVMLHGGGGSDTRAEQMYGWDDEAARDGFVVAYPDGIGGTWDAGRCCGRAQRAGVDDVAFLHALVLRLERVDGVDPKRIYAVGMSNGAMMTYTWACRDPGVLAGIGAVAGSLLTDCPSPHPITVVAIHGDADEHVPMDGGKGSESKTNVDFLSLRQTLAPFLAADQCPTTPTVATDPPVTKSVWSCADNTSVTTQIVAGAGHQWPGKAPKAAAVESALGLDPPSDAFDATDFLWQSLRSATAS